MATLLYSYQYGDKQYSSDSITFLEPWLDNVSLWLQYIVQAWWTGSEKEILSKQTNYTIIDEIFTTRTVPHRSKTITIPP